MALDIAKATVVLDNLTATFDKQVRSINSFYPTICTQVDSDGESETYGWIADMPGMREFLGERKFHELSSATYALTNKLWENSLAIPKTKIEDDRMSMFGPIMQQLALKAMLHPDELLFQVLVSGETELCYDEKSFFATDHEHGDSGTQSNDLTHTVSSTSAVTADEMKGAIRQAVKQLSSYKDDKGDYFSQPTIGRLNDLVLLVPLDLRDQAFDALESQLLGGGDSNVVIDKPQIVASQYLASSTKFYLFRANQPIGPLIFQARKPLERQIDGLDDIKSKDVFFMTEARYNIGYGLWQNAVLTTLTT